VAAIHEGSTTLRQTNSPFPPATKSRDTARFQRRRKRCGRWISPTSASETFCYTLGYTRGKDVSWFNHSMEYCQTRSSRVNHKSIRTPE